MAILAGISLIVAAETPPKNKIAKQTLAKSASVRRSYSPGPKAPDCAFVRWSLTSSTISLGGYLSASLPFILTPLRVKRSTHTIRDDHHKLDILSFSGLTLCSVGFL